MDVSNESCEGCQYYGYHCREVSYYTDEEWYTCKLFNCKIDDAQRWIACKSLEV